MLLPPPSSPSRTGSLFWPPLLATWGEGATSALHAHHAWHLVVARTGRLRVRGSARGRWREAAAVLTRPRAAHAIEAGGAQVLVVFVAPESELAARWRAEQSTAGPGAGVQLLDDEVAARVRATLPAGRLDATSVAAAMPALFAAAGLPPPAVARVHPGVRRVLAHLGAAPAHGDDPPDTSLAALAHVAGLSPGRFMHAFTTSVGLPLRPYLLWHKLGRAGAAIAAGTPLSDAAHAAGFADAAHLTRTFRRMFGVSPSEARRRSQFVQEPRR